MLERGAGEGAGALMEPPSTSAQMLRLDEMMIEQTTALVAALQAGGALTREIPAAQAAVAIYGTFTVAMLMWMAMPELDDAALHRSLDEQLTVVFRGLDPRPAERRKKR